MDRSLLCFLSLFAILSSEAIASPDSLRIIVTGGFRGRAEGCGCPSGKVGGLARRAAAMREMFNGEQVIGLDCGRILDLDPAGGKSASRCSFAGLAKMGLIAAGVVARDLYYGVDFLVGIASESNISLTCANIIDSAAGTSVFKTWLTVPVNAQTLAVTGLAEHAPGMRFHQAGQLVTIPVDSVLATLRSTIPQNADLVILLTDMSERAIRELIPAFPEINLVFSSSRQFYTPSPVCIGRALVVRPEPDGGAVEAVSIPMGIFNPDGVVFVKRLITRDLEPDDQLETWLKGCLSESSD